MLVMVATGIAETDNLTPDEFREMRAAVRPELAHYKMILKQGGDKICYLRRRRQKNSNEQHRHRLVHKGTFHDCCRRALTEIDPVKWPPMPPPNPWGHYHTNGDRIQMPQRAHWISFNPTR